MYKKKKVNPGFKAFTENLKNGKMGNILLMYGVEQYLVKWAVDTLVKKFVNPATKSMDYVVIDDDKEAVDSIIEASETFSMFSEKKIVWVRDFKLLKKDNVKGYGEADIERLSEYLKGSNSETLLIFSSDEIKETTTISTTLKKVGQIYEFGTLETGELKSFARKRFKAAGIEITPRMLTMLVEETGYLNKESDYRLYNFANDIQKIIAHSDGKTITEKDIIESVKGDMDTFVFDMLDGISGNQKDKAFALLNNMLFSGIDEFKIIGSIVSQFELMLSVKQLREDGLDLKSIHKKIGGSEFRIKKLIPYTNRYSVENLKKILSSIYEVDRQIKTGMLSGQLALELFISKI